MNIRVETLQPPYTDPLALAAAELITSDVYQGDETADYCRRHWGIDTAAGYALVGDDSELIGAATVNRSSGKTHIVDIAVPEQHRGNRYGTVLVKHIAALALARGDEEIIACTSPESGERRFFERLGFVPDPGEDEGERRLLARPSRLLS